MHAHVHPHAIHTDRLIRRFGWSVVLTIAFVIAEAAAGWWYNSLALLSDAGHNLADGATLLISLYALRMSRRAASQGKTFGYHRAGILAALVNGVSLVLIGASILYEGVHRLLRPEPVVAEAMIVVAAVAAGVNLFIALWLRRDGSKDVNVRSAVLHMFGDALFSLGVVLAGLIIFWTGRVEADAGFSILVALFIIWSSWSILKETVHILMEGTPAEIDMGRLVTTIREIPGVEDVHDLHVWMIASGIPVLTAHIVMEDRFLSESADVIDAVRHRLHSVFGIDHVTLQAECPACSHNDLFCRLQPDFSHHPHTH
jgi:cobalt-zinc-cadmium efflux system protein